MGAGVRVSLGDADGEGVAEVDRVAPPPPPPPLDPVGMRDTRAVMEEEGVEVGEGKGPRLTPELKEGLGEVV